MVDRAELRRLAEAAREVEPMDDYEMDRACDGNSTAWARVMRPYLYAVKDPDAVLGLLDNLESEERRHEATGMANVGLMWECDQLRAVAVRLKGVLLVYHEADGTDADCIACQVLADPEVEKL